MNLLAIDCACSILSVAVSKDEEVFYTELPAGVRHSEFVMDCIDSRMKKACLNAHELDGVLCMAGPGSFTGLRIGYSIAKGLALSVSIPFLAVPTLDCMAFTERNGGLTLAVIEARKNAWYYAFYGGEKCLKPAADSEICGIKAEIDNFTKIETEKITLTGAGALSLYNALVQDSRENLILKAVTKGYAKELITLAKNCNLLDNDNTVFLFSGPDYIRKTDAELNL